MKKHIIPVLFISAVISFVPSIHGVNRNSMDSFIPSEEDFDVRNWWSAKGATKKVTEVAAEATKKAEEVAESAITEGITKGIDATGEIEQLEKSGHLFTELKGYWAEIQDKVKEKGVIQGLWEFSKVHPYLSSTSALLVTFIALYKSNGGFRKKVRGFIGLSNNEEYRRSNCVECKEINEVCDCPLHKLCESGLCKKIIEDTAEQCPFLAACAAIENNQPIEMNAQEDPTRQENYNYEDEQEEVYSDEDQQDIMDKTVEIEDGIIVEDGDDADWDED